MVYGMVRYMRLPDHALTQGWSVALDGGPDPARFDAVGLERRAFNVWNFADAAVIHTHGCEGVPMQTSISRCCGTESRIAPHVPEATPRERLGPPRPGATQDVGHLHPCSGACVTNPSGRS